MGISGDFQRLQSDMNANTVGYYSFLAFWVVYLTYHYEKTNQTRESELENAFTDIKSAVYNAPNRDSFDEYGVLYQSILFADYQYRKSDFTKVDKAKHERVIRTYLEFICEFVARFMGDKNEMFSANIMFYHVPRTKADFEHLSVIYKKDEWIYKSIDNFNSLEGVFFVDLNLCFPEDSKNDVKIYLPFVDEDFFDGKQIPGACQAYIEG